MSRMRRLCTAFSLAASIALAGCGGETSSGEGDLSDDEILQLRALASLAPRLLEVLKDSAMLRHRCPTYRRLLDERKEG